MIFAGGVSNSAIVAILLQILQLLVVVY